MLVLSTLVLLWAGCTESGDIADEPADADISLPSDRGQSTAAAVRDPSPSEPIEVVEEPEPMPDAASASPVTDPAAAPPQRTEPLDLQKLFIDSAPIAESDVDPALGLALDGVRRALRERDFLSARQQLQAASRRKGPSSTKSYEDMLLVYSLCSQAFSHATAAARGLSVGEHVETWSGPALVQDKTVREIMLRLDGVPQTFSLRLSDMDVRLAAALVRHRAKETGLALDAHVAALWIMDRDGSIQEARDACAEAIQRGAYVDPLIIELRRRERQDQAATSAGNSSAAGR